MALRRIVLFAFPVLFILACTIVKKEKAQSNVPQCSTIDAMIVYRGPTNIVRTSEASGIVFGLETPFGMAHTRAIEYKELKKGISFCYEYSLTKGLAEGCDTLRNPSVISRFRKVVDFARRMDRRTFPCHLVIDGYYLNVFVGDTASGFSREMDISEQVNNPYREGMVMRLQALLTEVRRFSGKPGRHPSSQTAR